MALLGSVDWLVMCATQTIFGQFPTHWHPCRGRHLLTGACGRGIYEETLLYSGQRVYMLGLAPLQVDIYVILPQFIFLTIMLCYNFSIMLVELLQLKLCRHIVQFVMLVAWTRPLYALFVDVSMCATCAQSIQYCWKYYYYCS